MTWKICRQIAGAVALLAYGTPGAPVMASPQSVALTAEGLAQMNAGHPSEALVKYRAAMAADDTDPDPYFHTGVLLNRGGQWVGALGAFNFSAERGSKNPELLLERGKALLGANLPRRVILDLAAYDKLKPGRAETSELIGKALSLTGDYAGAGAAFDETLKRDGARAPMIAFYRAQIANAQGDKQKSADQLNALLRDYPQSPVAANLRERFARVAPAPAVASAEAPAAKAAPAPKPWSVAGGLHYGHNTNVIGIADGAPLPADISSEDSDFVAAEAGAAWLFRPTDADLFNVSYAGQFTQYTDLHQFDQQFHTAAFDYSHLLSPGLLVTLRGSVDFAFVDEEHYLTRPGARIGFLYRWANGQYTDGGAGVSKSNYDFRVFLPTLDRDGEAYTASLMHYIPLTGNHATIRIGAFSTINNTDGADYDYWAAGATAGLQVALPLGFSGDAGVSYNRDEYDNRTSLTGFLITRQDDVWRTQAQISHTVTRHADIALRYNEVWSGSNVGFFEYDQRSLSIGAVARF
ncbi:MAG: tetratricopeptide repeat protein [Alphaproteobacteria bacterium]